MTKAEVAERIARAHRAQSAWDEFLAPMIAAMREEYRERMVSVATTELATAARSDKITALSMALRIVDTIESGMLATIKDGELARADKLKAEAIEGMTDARRRLLNIVGH